MRINALKSIVLRIFQDLSNKSEKHELNTTWAPSGEVGGIHPSGRCGGRFSAGLREYKAHGGTVGPCAWAVKGTLVISDTRSSRCYLRRHGMLPLYGLPAGIQRPLVFPSLHSPHMLLLQAQTIAVFHHPLYTGVLTFLPPTMHVADLKTFCNKDHTECYCALHAVQTQLRNHCVPFQLARRPSPS